MYSDNWLSLGYIYGERLKVSKIVDYKVWTDKSNKVVGVTVNFELPNDFHYELSIDEWMKFLEKVLENTSLEKTQKLFEKFLCENNDIFKFEDTLKLYGIKYDKIAFY